MRGFVIRRVGMLLAVLALGFVLTQAVTPISDLIGIEDGLQFFLSSLVFVTAWRPTVNFFVTRPVNYGRFLALAVSFWAASFMMAAVWSVTWRAFGYSSAYGDNGLRFGFRYLGICGSICAIAAPQFFDQDREESLANLRRFGAVLGCIFLTVLVLVYGNRIERQIMHDTSPNMIEKH